MQSFEKFTSYDEQSVNMACARALKDMRLHAKLTQREISLALSRRSRKVDQPIISRMENGERSLIHITDFINWCIACDFTPARGISLAMIYLNEIIEERDLQEAIKDLKSNPTESFK